ncbi:MAG: restriction endonuclease subunit S, partial [Gammaproteobacteria bacterium]|nr:restriction endonuclease subunit S [Gammaproteobacteria bacterium]
HTKKTVEPKLRFPEFRGGTLWDKSNIGELFKRITAKNIENNNNVLTISAQKGLISQLEYFNKRVAAKDVTGYYLLQKGDFAYNKSYSDGYPMGAIKPLRRYEKGIVSTLYICFRANDLSSQPYFEQYFESGLLNSQLEKIAPEGGRAHGLLNVSAKDFFENINVFLPSTKEQQKIADCLSSIDELITAQAQKVDALKTHKKGLMQQLFPAEGEITPKLRFPEFRDAEEWNVSTIGKIGSVSSGGTPSRTKNDYWSGNIPWVTTTLIDFNFINYANEYITDKGLQNSSTKILPKDTILMAMYGQGKTRGKVAILGIEAAINQACAAIKLKKGMNTNFVFQNLAGRYDEIRRISNQGGQENLSGSLIKEISFTYPDINTNEQQKIADCLSSIDELITVQTKKVETLKAHKKGLMQQLFPAIDEARA